MKPTIEEVQKAAEMIQVYCNEWLEDYEQKMEPLKGHDIRRLTLEHSQIEQMRNRAFYIERDAKQLQFK